MASDRRQKLEECVRILREKGNTFMLNNVLLELQKLDQEESKKGS
jgi:hypothetical protein